MTDSTRLLGTADGEVSLFRLTAEVAHDLNNALNVVIGTAQLVAMDFPDDSPAREDLREIERTAGNAAEFTRRLLAYSRQRAQTPGSADLSQVVEEIREIVRETLGPR